MNSDEEPPLLDEDAAPAPSAVGPPRPVHLAPGNIALVFAGGTLGTALRYLVVVVVPTWSQLPLAIVTVNIAGAFVLAALLELLAGHGNDVGWSRRVRLGVGTGMLGGFTTYSSLAMDTTALALLSPGLAVGYGLGTVVVGAVASILGIGLVRHRLRPLLLERGRPA
ncbi:MAG: CrcB family protein [Microlunatus sp.]|nr:CrcB family protein [Microlunatus sp.]MDN5803855.1 CrcB family protein [Microlunatus sp.]